MKLEVIPQPRHVEALGRPFTVGAGLVATVTDTAADRFAARTLQAGLRESLGVECDILPVETADGAPHRLALTHGEAGPEAVLPAEGGLEGYDLRVGEGGVHIAAVGEPGLSYGVQTLLQLAEQAARDEAPVPGMAITDWPTVGCRGRYFDGSQYMGTAVVSRRNLEREIDTLARYKLNAIWADMYNLVPFASFPHCADENTLTLADWRHLVEYAHARHVTIIPSLQSFGQIYQVLWNNDEGKPYREETAPGMICPSRPENLAFLQGLYKDLLSVFRYSPYMGIGCSEVGAYAWQGRYCPRCQARVDAGETYYDLYLKHVQACAGAVEAAAEELGREVRPLMWADEFYMGYEDRRWEGLESIPKSMVMGHWQYWSNYNNIEGYDRTDYDGISGLLERGFDVLFLSASFEFNTYVHDLTPDEPKEGKWNALFDAGVYNVVDQARWADAHNRAGFPGKVLGGGCATFSQHDIRGWDTTWYAFVLEGEYTWGDPSRPWSAVKDEFTKAFGATYYEARDRAAADAIAAALVDLDAAKSDLEWNNYLIRDFIGEYDIHDNFYNGNTLEDSAKLVDELAANPKSDDHTVEAVRGRAERARALARAYRTKLAALAPRVGNVESLHYLASAAHKIENHATRTLYLLDQQRVLAQAAEAKDAAAREAALAQIDTLAQRLDALSRDTRIIADEMDVLAFGAVSKLVWSGEGTENLEANVSGDTTGYHKVLASLAGFGERLKAERRRLSE